MKSIVLAAAFVAAPLAAQTAPAPAPAPVPTPAPAPTTTPVPPSSATGEVSSKLTIDTPIETIAADPKGKAVLDADLANITSHPMYDQFKSMSLTQLQPMSQGALSNAALAKVKADLAAIK